MDSSPKTVAPTPPHPRVLGWVGTTALPTASYAAPTEGVATTVHAKAMAGKASRRHPG
ncbi:MAG: hypothetical protein ACXWJ4_08850 [Methyloceanibacter sp.]